MRAPNEERAFAKLSKCLYATRRALSKWNKEKIRNIFAAEIESKIHILQDKETSSGGISNYEKSVLFDHHKTLSSLLIQQECFFRQRSRICWLGDRNTVHRSATVRKRSNLIKSILDGDGKLTNSDISVREVFASFYDQFWATDSARGPLDEDLPGTLLSASDRHFLARQVDDLEITKALQDLPSGKAPGVDGMGASFYKSYCY